MKFSWKWKRDKLYKQWVKHSDLSPESIPQEESHQESLKEVPRDVPVSREGKGRGINILYILLGISIIILGVGLYLLFT